MTLLKFSFPVRTASGLWALLLVAATLLLSDHHAVAQQRLQFSLSLPKSAQAEQPKLSRILADDYEVKTADGRRVKFASLLKKNQPVLKTKTLATVRMARSSQRGQLSVNSRSR